VPDSGAARADTIQGERIKALARAVLQTEAAAVLALEERVDEAFVAATGCLLDCRGRVVVLGMGKSGHIASKIAATLASTGTPAFFVHPGEASHGDMGMITGNDVVLALSNSGETDELVLLLPLMKRLDVPLVTMTGNSASTLARAATVNLDVSVAKEACPLGLAPTASTTAALALGDALAVALLEARGFSADDFARAHPGGTLGRRLLLRLGDLMHTGAAMPVVGLETGLSDALLEMTRKGLGMTAVCDVAGTLLGVFTDGDLRRTLDSGLDVRAVRIHEVMTEHGKTADSAMLAAEGVRLMQEHRISALPIVDADRRLIGVVNMHDMLRAGVV